MKELTRLADKHLTDKGTIYGEGHGFSELYDDILCDVRNNELNILEIGIFDGASLNMWAEYFPNSTIHGLDIDVSRCEGNIKFDNIKCFQCDATNEDQLNHLMDELGNIKFDIVIDDGSHMFDHQIKSLLFFVNHLKEDAIYILEDLHTSLDDDGCNNPLYFLSTGKKIPMISDEQYEILNDKIMQVLIYNRKNVNGCKGRSITSIIKFD